MMHLLPRKSNIYHTQYNDGTVYSGSLNEYFEPHGEGCMSNLNGTFLRGKFLSGYLSHGSILNPSSEGTVLYEGECSRGNLAEEYRGVPNGSGRLIYQNGDCYVGEFQSGKRFGRGIFTRKSGERYQGEFKNDMCHGFGKARLLLNSTTDNRGQNMHTISFGYYSGHWENGRRSGTGSMTIPSEILGKGVAQCTYNGQWKHDMPNGKGVLQVAGYPLSVYGLWENGIMVQYESQL